MQTRKPRFLKSLSSQLLVLTVLFVMVIQAVIFVPSLAEYRRDYLDRRLVVAQVAALSLEEVPGQAVSPKLEEELLASAEIQAVIVLREDSRQLILRSDLPSELVARYDMRDPSFSALVSGAFDALKRKGEGSIQVQGSPINTRHQSVQIVMREAPLYQGMIEYSKSILVSTLIVSVSTAALIYLLLMILLVRPTQRIADNLEAFAKDPESPSNILKPRDRKNEIGYLETQISGMQKDLRKALRQKTRLANLGLAISKINHDLKNILSTARLSLDALELKPSAERREKILERLLRSVDRAVALGERTLKYGKAEEPAPVKEAVVLSSLAGEVRKALGAATPKGVEWKLDMAQGFKVLADRDQLYRVLFNLSRNALEAMPEGGVLTISAKAKGKGRSIILVSDTGPGIPENLRDHLFAPFSGSSKGGAGLGLAIASDLVKAHGGKIGLKEGGPGATFEIVLPNTD